MHFFGGPLDGWTLDPDRLPALWDTPVALMRVSGLPWLHDGFFVVHPALDYRVVSDAPMPELVEGEHIYLRKADDLFCYVGQSEEAIEQVWCEACDENWWEERQHLYFCDRCGQPCEVLT